MSLSLVSGSCRPAAQGSCGEYGVPSPPWRYPWAVSRHGVRSALDGAGIRDTNTSSRLQPLRRLRHG